MNRYQPAPDPGIRLYPTPTRLVRLAGIAGLVGAVSWPLTILVIASATQNCTTADCSVDRGSLALIALAPALFAITVLGLELRARRFLGLGDLIGDLTVATAAGLFLLSFVVGTIGFLGPALLLLLVGSLVFGIAGYLNGARPRVGSAVIAIGAGALLFLLLAGAAGGLGSGLETPWLFALLLYGVGWGWLGGNLLLARPLPIPQNPSAADRTPDRPAKRPRPTD